MVRYFGLLDNLTKTVINSYPGFRIRVYHNMTSRMTKFLCNQYCQYDQLDFCNVTKLRTKNYLKDFNMNSTFGIGRFWRFLPLIDPTVKIFFSRDIDSYILDREVKFHFHML